jgi:aminopeptidase-like protein
MPDSSLQLFFFFEQKMIWEILEELFFLCKRVDGKGVRITCVVRDTDVRVRY